jgi:hypothetical protein
MVQVKIKISVVQLLEINTLLTNNLDYFRNLKIENPIYWVPQYISLKNFGLKIALLISKMDLKPTNKINLKVDFHTLVDLSDLYSWYEKNNEPLFQRPLLSLVINELRKEMNLELMRQESLIQL